jgi:D-arabinose 1-dehydrogenase-like Zn-dependent alcohol dehydrogenase
MRQMHRQSLTAYGQPLCETVVECPSPRGSEVLVRIERCGVCHSDLHLQDGYFSLGGDKKLDVSAGRTLPFTLGHEIAGVIESVGADADAAIVDRRVAVYPWIGCGICAACLGGEENLCSNHRHLGIAVDGGFATHVLVPHQRYLLDYAPLSANFAGPLMCSGLTAYAALKRHTNRPERGPVLLIGLGGVGMMGLAITRALFTTPPISMLRSVKLRSRPAPRRPTIHPIRRRARR